MIWDVSRTSTWQKEAWPEQRASERRESEAEEESSCSEWEDESATRTIQPPSRNSLLTSDLPKNPRPPSTTHFLVSLQSPYVTSFAVVVTTIFSLFFGFFFSVFFLLSFFFLRESGSSMFSISVRREGYCSGRCEIRRCLAGKRCITFFFFFYYMIISRKKFNNHFISW